MPFAEPRRPLPTAADSGRRSDYITGVGGAFLGNAFWVPTEDRTATKRLIATEGDGDGGREKIMSGAGSVPGLNNLRLDQQGPNAVQGLDQSGASAQDPSKMDLKRLIEEIQRLVKQLMEAQQQKQGEQGGAPKSGGAEGAKEGGGDMMKLLESLMQELRKRNPQAVENAAQAIPGGPQALTAAANATSAAAAPAGIPSGFA